MICEEHRNQEKLCNCPDQKELITCLKCEESGEIKDIAAKRNFWLPGFLFLIMNAIIFIPVVIEQISMLQEIKFDKDLAVKI